MLVGLLLNGNRHVIDVSCKAHRPNITDVCMVSLTIESFVAHKGTILLTDQRLAVQVPAECAEYLNRGVTKNQDGKKWF